MKASTLALLAAAAVVMCFGCGPKGDVPPPSLHKVSTPPDADVSAFNGALKVTNVEIAPGGHNLIVHGEAVQDLGNAPFPVTVDFLDAAGASLGNTEAMLVLDPMPERPEPQTPIPAGSKVFMNVNAGRVSQDPAKIVIRPGGGPRPPMGPGGMGPGGPPPPR